MSQMRSSTSSDASSNDVFYQKEDNGEAYNTHLLNRIINEYPFDFSKPIHPIEINLSDRSPFNGNTPLLLAVKRGDVKLTLFLLSQGAKVDICDARGYYPIHYAAMLREEKMLTPLIQHSSLKLEELNRLNEKTEIFTPQYKPKYKTLDWENAIYRGDTFFKLTFTPLTATKLLTAELLENDFVLAEDTRGDSFQFRTKLEPYSNLRWHIRDIVKNLDLENTLTDEEVESIKNQVTKIANKKTYLELVDKHYHNDNTKLHFNGMSQYIAEFVARRIFVIARAKKQVNVEKLTSSFKLK